MYEVILSYEKSPQTLMITGGASILTASYAGGHWFESSSLHQKVPDFVRNQELFLFISSNSDAAFWRFSLDPNGDPKAEMTGEERIAASAPLSAFFVITLPD